MKSTLASLADTEKLARNIASDIQSGSVCGSVCGDRIFALTGPVGAGKTTFVKLFAAALGVRTTVVSPTYTLLQPYELPRAIRGITTLVHIDAYRLENAAELRAVGAEDFLNDGACVVVIEWAERVEALLAGRPVTWMNFEIENGTRGCTVYSTTRNSRI